MGLGVFRARSHLGLRTFYFPEKCVVKEENEREERE